MKVYFDKNGVLNITPETEKEDQELWEWYKSHKRRPTNEAIVFNRVGDK